MNTTEKMNKVPLEDVEIEAFANYLRARWLAFSNVMNEFWIPWNILGIPKRLISIAIKRVSAYIWAKRKRHWVSPWVPDFFIVWEWQCILWIEMKRQKPIGKRWLPISSPSKVSPEQIEWCRLLDTIPSVQAEICYWCQEAIELVERIDKFLKEKVKKDLT